MTKSLTKSYKATSFKFVMASSLQSTREPSKEPSKEPSRECSSLSITFLETEDSLQRFPIDREDQLCQPASLLHFKTFLQNALSRKRFDANENCDAVAEFDLFLIKSSDARISKLN